MKEKFFFIDARVARKLLNQISNMKPSKNGSDSSVYLFDEYAVLTTSRIKRRNVTISDDDLAYLDELIRTLYEIAGDRKTIIPILGYCYDPASTEGDGYIFQPRAKGAELWDDTILMSDSDHVQFEKTKLNRERLPDEVRANYLLSRTEVLANAPQEHYNQFIADIITLTDHDILIDSMTKENFFYDEKVGFQFVDLDAHNDYKYGLDKEKPDGKWLASKIGFMPCPFIARCYTLDPLILAQINQQEKQKLIADNRAIFEKVKRACIENDIPQKYIDNIPKPSKFPVELSIWGRGGRMMSGPRHD
ncbi:MAG: hypothetical protein LBU87_06050 [Lactobacillales bacterium]|jgi:hypothetical protein|nr:hypothetical protein [Lactobacillales bacterium]